MYTRGYLWLSTSLVLAAVGCDGRDRAAPPIAPSSRSWSAPEKLDDGRLSLLIQVAHDSRGNALVVWDDLEGKVNATRYDASRRTWTETERLDTDNPDDSAAPSVAMDADGNAVAVWQRQAQLEDRRSVWTCRYDASQGQWGDAEPIANSERVLAPQVAMDGAGNAVLAFTRSEIGAPVMTAHFDVRRGSWSKAEPLAAAQGIRNGAPRLAMSPQGMGVAIWLDGDLEASTIWAARYDTKSRTWRDAQQIGARAEMALPSGVAINEAGAAVAVWAQMDGERFTVWTSRSEAMHADWSKPERIDLEARGDALLPRIAIDEEGNALAAWSAHDVRQLVWTNRYSAAERAWQGSETIDAGDFDAFAPDLGIDGDGNAVVVWTREREARRSAWAGRYSAAEGTWSTPEPLASEMDAQAESVELEVMRDGRALAVWSRNMSSIVASQLR